MTHEDENEMMGQLIQAMLEAGFAIQEIERQLGVKIQVQKLDHVLEVIHSSICGKIEVNVN